ncbi:MAG: hypothetical protein R3C12_04035 [Planctomycetaceae bacterium]
MYRPEGTSRNLAVCSPVKQTRATKRRELMVNWFGPHAERWIQNPGDN